MDKGSKSGPRPMPGNTMGQSGLNDRGNYNFKMGQNRTPFHAPMSKPDYKNPFESILKMFGKDSQNDNSQDMPAQDATNQNIAPDNKGTDIMKKLSLMNLFNGQVLG